MANAENYFGETHEFFDAQDNLIALVDVAAVKPGRMTPAEELAALKAQGFRDGRDSMAGFIPVPKNALRDFIEYSVHGPYGSDEKWLADKKTLVSAALSYPSHRLLSGWSSVIRATGKARFLRGPSLPRAI